MNKFLGVIAVIALVIAIAGVHLNSITSSKFDALVKTQKFSLGGFTNFDQLALGSTTPSGTFPLIIGNSGATTTIFAGRLCLVTQTLGSGSNYLYYYPATSTGNAAVSGWATTTTPCI